MGVTVESVNHPSHYGGADNVYEAIKVIEAWNLGFCLGNCVKYICRAGKKPSTRIEITTISDKEPKYLLSNDVAIEDLRKARWYLDREIQKLEGKL
jgi:hypothetical protein